MIVSLTQLCMSHILQVLRTILRGKMYDLVDAIGFMLPDLKTSSAYSVYKQLYDASELTLAADLFMVKMFTPKLIMLTEDSGECPNLTHMGRLVDKAVDALAESLRVR